MKRFARYIRVSEVGDRGDKLRSPDYQRSLDDRFAELEGIELVDYPDELDVSGSKRTRVVLDRILADIASGELDGLVVAKLDRLSRLAPRDRVELFELVEETYGARILSATESNDISTPEGRFVRELFLSLARLEWERAALGFDTAKAAAIAAGVAIMVKAPFGFRFDDEHRLIPGPRAERELLTVMLEQRLAGASYARILETFETATGRRSSRATIEGMLANEAYIGVLSHGKHRNESAHAPLVERELFLAVREQKEHSTREWRAGRRPSGKGRAMLSGIARCAKCNATLTSTEAGGAGQRYYRCPSPKRQCGAGASINQKVLDAYVGERLLEWAGPAADAEVEVELEIAGDRDGAEKRLEVAERRLREWAADVELEEADERAYRDGLEAREALVVRRRQDLDELGEASIIEAARTTLRQSWPELATDERRRLLRVVIAGLVVARSPRFNAPAADRATLTFYENSPPPTGSQNRAELVEQAA